MIAYRMAVFAVNVSQKLNTVQLLELIHCEFVTSKFRICRKYESQCVRTNRGHQSRTEIKLENVDLCKATIPIVHFVYFLGYIFWNVQGQFSNSTHVHGVTCISNLTANLTRLYLHYAKFQILLMYMVLLQTLLDCVPTMQSSKFYSCTWCYCKPY